MEAQTNVAKEIKPATASDVMKKALEKIPVSSGVLAERMIASHPLSGDSDYSYCPKCAVKNRRIYGEAWKTHMKPMWVAKFKVLIRINETTARKAYDTRWNCPDCGKNVTLDDFMDVYCAKSEAESPIVDLTKVDVTDPYFSQCF